MGLIEKFRPYVRALGIVTSVWVFAYFLAAVSLLVGFSSGIEYWHPIAERTATTVLMSVGFAAAVGTYAYCSGYFDGVSISLPARDDLRFAALMSSATLAVMIAITLLFDYGGHSLAKHEIATGGTPELLLLFLVPMLFIGIPAEELVYRWAIQGRLREAFSPVGAIGGSTLLYVATPFVLDYMGQPVTWEIFGLLLISACIGVGAGIIYERTQSIVASAAVHGIYDTMLVVFMYMSATGIVTPSPFV